MSYLLKKMTVLCVAVLILIFAMLIDEKRQLKENVIRLHVVAASDSLADQSIKLEVRDAVLQKVSQLISDDMRPQQAKAALEDNLQLVEQQANQILASLGCDSTATVTLMEERFPKREYDTFSLPAGVYESLRVTIGEGAGRNWWCVVFPSLCVSATSEEFEDLAVAAGFSEEMARTMTGEYEIRFFLLECLGRVENFLWEF